MRRLNNKNIIIGITGSISAYKAPDIIRRMQEEGADVKVVLTEGGREFITELTLQTISKNQVHSNIWDKEAELSMGHISLARWADIILIAPASANTISNLADGKANNLLSTIILASQAHKYIAPSMNVKMFESSQVQRNLLKLESLGFHLISPDNGSQACGDVGAGRLAETSEIIDQISNTTIKSKFNDRNVLVTLGSTREYIDPVRYLSNRSSGKMGGAIVDELLLLGANVTVVAGHKDIDINSKAIEIKTNTADEMYEEVIKNIKGKDIFISTAAVVDFKVREFSQEKIKKKSNSMTIEFIKNTDILSEVSTQYKDILSIGFAAETNEHEKHALEKLENKGCDAIILNDVSDSEIGFESDENAVTIYGKKFKEKIEKNSKKIVGREILKIIEKNLL